MKTDRISTELEIQTIGAMEALKRAFREIKRERLDECGTVTHQFECEEQDEMDALTIAGNDLEHLEEYRKAVRSYQQEERWLS